MSTQDARPWPDETRKPHQAPQGVIHGDEPMTGAQAEQLKALCEQAEIPFDPELTKAEAERLIVELEQQHGWRQDGL